MVLVFHNMTPIAVLVCFDCWSLGLGLGLGLEEANLGDKPDQNLQI